MESFDLKIALDLHKSLIDHINTLYNFFAVIVIALVGAFYGGVKLGDPVRARNAVTLPFIVWAWGNGWAVYTSQILLGDVVEAMNWAGEHPREANVPTAFVPFLTDVQAARPELAILFHVVLSAGALGAIWWPTLKQASQSPAPGGGTTDPPVPMAQS